MSTPPNLRLIGFGSTSFHAHMNLECLGFIQSEKESEDSYATVWTAFRKSLHALLYKVKRCCIHGCEFCSELESVFAHALMAEHKDSDDFKKHTLPVKLALGDQHEGGKNFAQNVLHLLSGVCHTHATVINKKKGTQRAHLKNKDIHEEWYEFVLAVARCPYENVGITLQALTVKWLNAMDESDAARRKCTMVRTALDRHAQRKVAACAFILWQCHQQQLP